MNRTKKSLIITTVAGFSLGALVSLYSIGQRPSDSISELTYDSSGKRKATPTMRARRAMPDRASTQIDSLTPSVEEKSEEPEEPEAAPNKKDQSENGDGPNSFMSLERTYIAEALKRQVIDTKTWQDRASGRYIKGTLVKDDGEYGYLLVKQIYDDKELTKAFTETVQIGDHVMVQFEKGQDKDSLDSFMKLHNLSLKRKMLLPGSFVFISDVVSVDHMQNLEESLQMVAGIKNAEPNFLMFASLIPNDPKMNQLWGFKNDGRSTNGSGGYQPGNDTRVHKAWDKITDCRAKIVAVLDTGVDFNHPDLRDNMSLDLARNFTTNDPTDYMDRQNHGTHCAGTIGAVGNNREGVPDVCWQAQIVPIKVLSDKGNGSNKNITDALVYLAGTNVDILSMSLGGGGYNNQMSQAIDMNAAKNKLLIIAAGNDNKDIGANPAYPAAYQSEGIITVSAYNGRGDLAGFSNYGSRNSDIAAPGEDIMSTYPGNRYAAISGTSMATPVTAGIVALFWSYGPKMSAQDVKKELFAATDKGSFSRPISQNRKVNAEKVLEALNPKASPKNASKGGTIGLVNSDSFEFQVKNDNAYTTIKSIEVFEGTQSLGRADGDKVAAKIPLSSGTVKLTVKVTDEQGRTYTTDVVDLSVDLTKSIDLSAIDVSDHQGDIACSSTRTNEQMEKTVLFSADVESVKYCNKLCRTLAPTAFTTKGSLDCSGEKAIESEIELPKSPDEEQV